MLVVIFGFALEVVNPLYLLGSLLEVKDSGPVLTKGGRNGESPAMQRVYSTARAAAAQQ